MTLHMTQIMDEIRPRGGNRPTQGRILSIVLVFKLFRAVAAGTAFAITLPYDTNGDKEMIMRFSTIMGALLAGTLLFSACSSTTSTDQAKAQQIELKKGELFMVITATTKSSAGKLRKQYFKDVFPVAGKHGFKMKMRFKTPTVLAGKHRPNSFIGLFTWPSVASQKAFSREPGMSNLDQRRRKIWSELQQFRFKIKRDTKLTFYKGKVYQVMAIWPKRNSKGIKKYLKATKSAFNKNGGRLVLRLPVDSYETLKGRPKPAFVGIVEWPSEDDRVAYVTSKAYKNNVRFFSSAVNRFQAFLTSVM